MLAVAGGQEHRLGRWHKDELGSKRLTLFRMPDLLSAERAADSDGEDEEDDRDDRDEAAERPGFDTENGDRALADGPLRADGAARPKPRPKPTAAKPRGRHSELIHRDLARPETAVAHPRDLVKDLPCQVVRLEPRAVDVLTHESTWSSSSAPLPVHVVQVERKDGEARLGQSAIAPRAQHELVKVDLPRSPRQRSATRALRERRFVRLSRFSKSIISTRLTWPEPSRSIRPPRHAHQLALSVRCGSFANLSLSLHRASRDMRAATLGARRDSKASGSQPAAPRGVRRARVRRRRAPLGGRCATLLVWSSPALPAAAAQLARSWRRSGGAFVGARPRSSRGRSALAA